ncbi:MAG: hypothetical protein E7484_03100 [Ruminococcaceae bacterium]|nr:hypothetical protein [Oscillospiraceae bacterium]
MNIIKLIRCDNKNKMITAAVGAAVGLTVFLVIYGFSALNPLNESFVLTGYLEKDIAQHYAGWKLFRNSPWQFPLGVGQNIEYPYGGSVSYTDSIPLFAIFFKLLSPVLPQTFQYFGLFICLCFVLQGVFGALLVNLFTNCTIYCGLGAFLLCLSPVMTERAFRHCALTAHFIIIAALYYYFKNKKSCCISYIPFYIINIAAITIHPYFLPFSFAIMFAFAVEDFFLAKNRIKSVLHVMASIVITLVTGYCIGAFYNEGGMAILGYGYFSMNLNAFFNPVSKGFESENNWSAVLSDRPLFGGQIEGFNYLGIGIIIAIAISAVLLIIKHRKDIVDFIKNHFGIIFSALCLTVFAVGDGVYYGGLLLFRYPLSQDIIIKYLNIFRGNGRFGWMLFYLLFLFAMYGISRYIGNKKLAAAALCIICFIQLFDIGGVLLEKHNYFYNFSAENRQCAKTVAQHPFWEETVQQVDGVIEMQSEQGSMFGNGMIDIASLCGEYDKYINSTFAARTSVDKRKDVIEYQKSLLAQGNWNNVLYIVEETKLFDSLIANGSCQAFEVDGQLVVIPAMYSDAEIAEFETLGSFKQIIIK